MRPRSLKWSCLLPLPRQGSAYFILSRSRPRNSSTACLAFFSKRSASPSVLMNWQRFMQPCARGRPRDAGTGSELRMRPLQLKREWSLWPEFGWIPANLCDFSKG
jgi:hypothetical protein